MRICTIGFEDGGYRLADDIVVYGYSHNTVWSAPWGNARCIDCSTNGTSGCTSVARTYLRDMTPLSNGDFTHVFVRIWTKYSVAGATLKLSLTDENNVDIITIDNAGNFAVLGITDALGASYSAFSTDWKCVELEIDMSVSGGVTVRYDSVQVYTKTVDMTSSGGSEVRYAGVTALYHHPYAHAYYDDIAVNDTQGATNNSWPPTARIAGLVPNGDGAYSQWSPSPGTGESNYEDVDEIPGDSDTTYVAAPTGALRDTYTRANIAAFLGLSPRYIYMVTPITIARLSAAGTAQYRSIATKGVTTQVGTTHSPSDVKYGRFGFCMDDAPDGSPWDETTFDATIFGIDSL